MTKGYNSEPGQYDCMQFDVLLAEYVDGTIDPVVREVFEELLQQDPDVAAQVERLNLVRSRLCGLGCRCAAPPGFESRLKHQIAVEACCDAYPEEVSRMSGMRYTTLLTMVVLVLLVGSTAYTVMSQQEAVVTQGTDDLMERPSMFDEPAIYLNAAGLLKQSPAPEYPWSSNATSGAVPR